MKPTVGRVVHYQNYGREEGTLSPLAAIVTETYEDDEMEVALFVLYPADHFFRQHVPFSEIPKLAHWNWPPR
jgi:hypothetical protein